MVQPVANQLEHQRAQHDAGEDPPATAEQTDAADHDHRHRVELQALAEIGGDRADLQRVEHAPHGGQHSAQDERDEYEPIDRHANSAGDILAIADRGELAAEYRTPVQQIDREHDREGDQRVAEKGPDRPVAEFAHAFREPLYLRVGQLQTDAAKRYHRP